MERCMIEVLLRFINRSRSNSWGGLEIRPNPWNKRNVVYFYFKIKESTGNHQ